jgi:hypothetical protein
MKVGDPVSLWGRNKNGLNGPHHHGIFMGWDSRESGWDVLVEGEIEKFSTAWWVLKKTEAPGREIEGEKHGC